MEYLKPILIVDDSVNDVELITVVLQEDGRIANRIEAVYDGAEALDYLYRRGKFQGRPEVDPGVILLDLKMPKVGGFEVLETIRNDAQLKHIPIVILTSSKEDRDIVNRYADGANACVFSPVDPGQFIEAIKHLGLFWGIINVLPD